MTSPLSAGGLILDIAGAFALAMAFMFKTPKRAMAEADPRYSFNTELVISLAKQTADAWTGFALLAAGFGAQLAANLGARPSWAYTAFVVPLAVLIAGASLVGLFLWFRPLKVIGSIDHRLGAYVERERIDLFRAALIGFGYALRGRKWREGESPDEAGLLVLGERRWQRFKNRHKLPSGALAPFTQNDGLIS